MPVCFCAIGCQYSTLNRLFGCVFLVWHHHSQEVNKSSVRSFRRFFLQFSYCLMFLDIQIDLIILKTFDQKFTLTTKKSLHIIFKVLPKRSQGRAIVNFNMDFMPYWRCCTLKPCLLYDCGWLINWLVVLRPIRQKIGRFGDVPHWYGKTKPDTTKSDIHQSKEMYYNTK